MSLVVGRLGSKSRTRFAAPSSSSSLFFLLESVGLIWWMDGWGRCVEYGSSVSTFVRSVVSIWVYVIDQGIFVN